MNTRLVLATLAVLAALSLAGCSAAGSLRMEPVEDKALAEHASEPTSGADFPHEQARQRTASRVIENSPVALVAAEPPLETSLPYEFEGRYYNLSRDVVGTTSGARTLVSLDYNGTAPNASRVAFADLSAADRRQLRPYVAHEPRDFDDGAESGTLLTYTDEERAASVLADYAGERVVVTYRGTTRVLDVEPLEETTLREYRYTATAIADSAGEYARQLKREYAFTLRNLNESQRSVVAEAIDGGYYADSTDDTAFGSLVERFRHHEAVEADEYSGSWVVRYRGQLYWAEMDYGGFVADATASVTPPSVTPN